MSADRKSALRLLGFFILIGLSWINIYSFFTLRNSNWMTRKLKNTAGNKQT